MIGNKYGITYAPVEVDIVRQVNAKCLMPPVVFNRTIIQERLVNRKSSLACRLCRRPIIEHLNVLSETAVIFALLFNVF